MEEKNKPENNQHGHKKHSKHRAYFLEPKDNNPKENDGKSAPAEVNKAPAGNTNQNPTGQNQSQNQSKNHKKKHKKRPPQAKDAQQASTQKADDQKAASAPQAAPQSKDKQSGEQQNPQRSNQSKNHNRTKQHNKQNHGKSENLQKKEDKLSNPLIMPMPVPEKKTAVQSDEFEEVHFDFGSDGPLPSMSANSSKKKDVPEDEPKVEIVGIRFKPNSKVYYFDPKGKKFVKGTHAIVETARGLEYGEVAVANSFVGESETVPPIRPAIRTATKEDDDHHKANKIKEDEAFKLCNERIIAHKLDMKLIEAQYTFDNTKLLFYFSSAGRVDFRELVKDLASLFRTRIELRQIGIRDEAKIMGGLGICGRPLCCSRFLSDFGQVSIKMAKEQNLSLNSSKISGICGRLMCCLRYEQETYEYEIKRTPPVDSYVRTENGDGVVTEINPLAGTVKVRLLASPDVPPKTYKREELTVLRKKNNG